MSRKKDYIDYIIDNKVNVKTIYKFFGIHVSEDRNIVCPHHFDKTPSARIYENHLFCFSEKESYYSSDVLFDLSQKEYEKTRAKFLSMYPEKHKNERSFLIKTLEMSKLEPFIKGECSFDSVLDFIKESENHIVQVKVERK